VDLDAVLDRQAQLERRAMLFYRGLAERFHAHAAAARLWRMLSDAEAGHFAVLGLARDWVAMAGAAGSPPAAEAEALDLAASRLGELEAAAGAGCGLEEAVDLSIRWEEVELPRVLALAGYLPAAARGRVLAALVADAAEHYRVLGELVNVAGRAEQAGRVAALADRARAAL
jgi:rubrerythrin